MRETWQRAMKWVTGHGWVVLAVVGLICLGVLAFIELTDQVFDGDTQDLDNQVLQWVGAHRGPHWVQEMGRDATALGGVLFLMLTTLACAGYLLMVRQIHAMVLVLVSSAGGMLLSFGLKLLFDRERPAVFEHASYVSSSSFPSGHAMMSAAVYLTLGAILWQMVPRPALKVYVLVVAMLMTALTGISRIYVGVHYPTDVLAGWCAGTVWALLCWLVARYLQRRGAVELDTEETPPRSDRARR